ncbi:hypothetical protein [Halorussus amylolyticus]|uniref:hypothetical protein n=1 Tax=Halorussus amylolyticus TaxID=1126242 RepID=UPI0010446864|nr:hypothetical protein [Halorussus amylolyticus]
MGDNFGLSKRNSSVEPDEFVSPRNRIAGEKLVINVAALALGIIYRHDFGVLFVDTVSGNLENDYPTVGIVVAIESLAPLGNGVSKHETFDGPPPVSNIDVTDDSRLYPLHLETPIHLKSHSRRYK